MSQIILRCAVDQPNRWAFRCRANVRGERVAVCRAAGKLLEMMVEGRLSELFYAVLCTEVVHTKISCCYSSLDWLFLTGPI